jgi:signal transduction histidine kinase
MASDQQKTKKTIKRNGLSASRVRETAEETGEVKECPLPERDEPGRADHLQHREFLFKTFHDMRNPLHAIMGYTSLVLRKNKGQLPERHQENLGKVLQSAERLKEIVDRMVTFYQEK